MPTGESFGKESVNLLRITRWHNDLLLLNPHCYHHKLFHEHGLDHVRKASLGWLFVEISLDRDEGRFFEIQRALQVLNGDLVTCIGIQEGKRSIGAPLLRGLLLNLDRFPLNDDLSLVELVRIFDDLRNGCFKRGDRENIRDQNEANTYREYYRRDFMSHFRFPPVRAYRQ